MMKRKLLDKVVVFLVVWGIATWVTMGIKVVFGNGSGEPDPLETNGIWHANVEYRDDVHRPDALWLVIETYPPSGWPVVNTLSHTAETLGYSLIQIRGLSVPSQFPERDRPLIFVERERERFDAAMSYVWALLKECETLVLRNPEPIQSKGYIVCDVDVRIGGRTLNLAEMLINDGHARPAGKWDWGARIVEERR